MTNIDQFESMFRSSAREIYQHETIEFDSVLVVTDRDENDAKVFGERIREFLTTLSIGRSIEWRAVTGSEFHTAGELLELVEDARPSLICTYRNLHSSAWRWPFSLGAHLDLLTQHTDVPVMALPHPEAERSADHAVQNTDSVMAITDHLAGDDRLVNHALRFVADGGTLWLTHIDDDVTFERYMDAISKIRTIDTDSARDALRRQLLKEPSDYITNCAEALMAKGLSLKVERLVSFGHHLSEYRRLIDEHAVDLLVMNTKNEDQMAMHGIAYALAVELRHVPLLML